MARLYGKAVKSMDSWYNETMVAKKEQTKIVNNETTPDILIFTDSNTSEVLFKIKGNHEIEFHPEITKKGEQTLAFIEGIRNYFPSDKRDAVRAIMALHYCYAAMQSTEKDLESGKITQESQKLWKKAKDKAKECFY